MKQFYAQKDEETRNEAISCVFLVFSSMKIGKADYV